MSEEEIKMDENGAVEDQVTDTVIEQEPEAVEETPQPEPAPAVVLKRVVQEVSDLSELPADEDAYSASEVDELMELYGPTLNVKENEIVKGKVLSVNDEIVVVDIGFKSEGTISLSEFPEPGEVKAGDEIEVYVESVENAEGQVVVSKQKADFMRVWDRIKEAYDSGLPVSGALERRIKGGIVVDLFGVEAFLPGSQIDLRQVKNFEQYLGQTFDFRIIKLNKSRRNIVVSRRILLEEERESMRGELLKTLEKDQIREGVVKNITDFGAFIDLGGVDGLLHITDMSWGRINHPSEVVKIGEQVRVKVLNYDRDCERISLGLKQLTAYPWEGVTDRYPEGVRITGRVVSITDYGAFVELEEGVEGLIHVSEMSWTQHVRHPSKIVTIGDDVECMVLRVDQENEKISLGLKQIQPDPWETLDSRYPIGTKLDGKVRNITNFGVFVEIEEGIDGLVHISDLSWTRRVKHPSELTRKNDDMPVVIMNIDKDQRRISLSHKHCEDNPWDELETRYEPGTSTVGKVSGFAEKGLTVELEGDVEGFVPISQLAIENINDVQEHFTLGEELNLLITEFDRDQKRIILSVRRYMERQSEDELQEYLDAHPVRPVTIEEAVTGEEQVEDAKSAEAPAPAKEEAAPEAAVEEVAEEATPEVVAEEAVPEVIAEEATPEVVAEEAVSEVIAEEATPEAVAEEAVPEVVAEEATPEVVAEEAVPEVIAEEATPEVVAEEAVPEVVAEEATSEVVADEAVPEVIAEEATPEVVAEEAPEEKAAEESEEPAEEAEKTEESEEA
jgi:small subunit ribosomal protein S1